MALGFGFDLMSQAVRQRPWTPRFLFGDGEQGAWYDPSDFATLYQDSAGTTPVTDLGQPVGLMLDKSQGGKPTGPNIFTGTGWTLPTGWAYANGELTYDGSGTINSRAYIPITFAAGVSHVVTFTVEQRTGIFGVAWATAGAAATLLSLPAIASTEPYQAIAVPQGAVLYFQVLSATNTLRISNISVREIPGNHAAQGTAAARPTVQARKNLLESTEEFDNTSVWSLSNVTVEPNATVAPDGTMTADKIVSFNGTAEQRILEGFSVTSGTWSVSIYAKSAGVNQIYVFTSLGGNTAQLVTLTDEWQRITFEGRNQTIAGSKTFRITLYGSGSQTGDGTSGVYLWGAQLEQNSTATTYQRVTTATDYADIGLPRYLEFDGVDDAMATQSVDFSASDEMTVCAGVVSEAPTGTEFVYELSASTTNPGTFGGYVATTDAIVVRSHGTTLVINDSTLTPWPRLLVSTLIADISAPSLNNRVNAVDSINTGSQGTGNFGNYPINIGARDNGAAFEFTGRIHQLIVRGATTSGALLDQTERFVARKTGVSL